MSRTEPRPPKRTERYLCISCSADNLYKVLDYEHPSRKVTFRGWLPKETILQRFGATAVYFSDNHYLCPPCYRAGIKLDETV